MPASKSACRHQLDLGIDPMLTGLPPTSPHHHTCLPPPPKTAHGQRRFAATELRDVLHSRVQFARQAGTDLPRR